VFNTKLVIETATALISKISETSLPEATTRFCVCASLYVSVAFHGEAIRNYFGKWRQCSLFIAQNILKIYHPISRHLWFWKHVNDCV